MKNNIRSFIISVLFTAIISHSLTIIVIALIAWLCYLIFVKRHNKTYKNGQILKVQGIDYALIFMLMMPSFLVMSLDPQYKYELAGLTYLCMTYVLIYLRYFILKITIHKNMGIAILNNLWRIAFLFTTVGVIFLLSDDFSHIKALSIFFGVLLYIGILLLPLTMQERNKLFVYKSHPKYQQAVRESFERRTQNEN